MLINEKHSKNNVIKNHSPWYEAALHRAHYLTHKRLHTINQNFRSSLIITHIAETNWVELVDELRFGHFTNHSKQYFAKAKRKVLSMK